MSTAPRSVRRFAAPRRANRPRCSASDGGRLLRIGLKVCIVMLAVVGLLHLHARLPRPAVPSAVAAAIVRLGDPFSRMVHGLDHPQPLVRASEPMFAAIRRAERLEARGRFGPGTRRAWQRAGAELDRLGFMPIATAGGGHVRLFMQEAEEGRMAELAAMLEELLPGRFAAHEAERQAAAAREPAGRDSLPAVTWQQVAATAPDSVRPAAMSLAAMHEQAGRNVRTIARLRERVGFDHWRTTCAAGMSETGLAARAALWRADYGVRQAAFDLAKELYETGFSLWRDACVAVPELARDPFAASEMAGHEARYREVLAALGDGTAAGSGAAGAL